MKKIFLVPLLFFVFSNNGVAETLKADCICVHDGYVNAHFYERPKEHSVIIGDKSNGDILKIGDVVKILPGSCSRRLDCSADKQPASITIKIRYFWYNEDSSGYKFAIYGPSQW